MNVIKKILLMMIMDQEHLNIAIISVFITGLMLSAWWSTGVWFPSILKGTGPPHGRAYMFILLAG